VMAALAADQGRLGQEETRSVSFAIHASACVRSRTREAQTISQTSVAAVFGRRGRIFLVVAAHRKSVAAMGECDELEEATDFFWDAAKPCAF